MSTYNGARFLEPQLESLSCQEGVIVDLCVRDDGSSDNTRELLAGRAAAWPQLRNIVCGTNLGPANSFLELLRTASPDADYYAFCDQDDVWRPGKLKRAADALAGVDGPALYCSNVTCVAEDLTVIGVPAENGDARFQHLLFENIAYGCTTVMNRAARQLIVDHRPEQGVIMHDWWCALVVAAFGRVVFDAEPGMILYRQHGRNAVGQQADLFAATLHQVLRLMKERSTYYRAHAQATELYRLYGAGLPPLPRRLTERFVRSKESISKRIAYALSGEINRSRLTDAIAARALVVAGWY
jgi:glycosyltransferase involved in cell wall biosynthesis